MRSLTMVLRDAVTSDQKITEPAEKYMKRIEKGLPDMSVENRQAAVRHLGHYLNYYYMHHHRGNEVPKEVAEKFTRLSEKATKLNAIDSAKAYLAEHGSPREAFARFVGQAKEQEPYRGVQIPAVQQSKSHSVENSIAVAAEQVQPGMSR